MNLVSQSPFPNACQHACIAMLTGKPLAEIIAAAGTCEQLPFETRKRLLAENGLIEANWCKVEPFGENALGALVRRHDTLWLSLYSCVDGNFGHAVLLHNGDLYDPHEGLNPRWPWHRYVGEARAIVNIEFPREHIR